MEALSVMGSEYICVFANHASAFLQIPPMSGMCENAPMEDARTRVRKLLEGYMAETAMKPSQLARMANLAPSSITRFLNDPNAMHIPTTRTLEKLEVAMARWRAAQDGAATGAGAPGGEQIGCFVQDPEKLAWLRIFDIMLPADRKRAGLLLRAMATDLSKIS